MSASRASTTRYFTELDPERIHEALRQAGLECQPAMRFLNSLENRVALVTDADDEKWVVKFYRPGRWSREALAGEHDFVRELRAAGLPVLAPRALGEAFGGGSMGEVAGIYFAVFEFGHGRPPDEVGLEQAVVLGELLARVHEVGARAGLASRPVIHPLHWGRANLDHLRRGGEVPASIWPRYEATAQAIIEHTAPWFDGVDLHRIHGDCHRGNLLWHSQGVTLVDFDDTAVGPAVQDVWMLIPGRDDEAVVAREALLASYERRRPFDRRTLRLVEPLRALRFVHFAAWLIARKDDPAVRRVFDDVGTPGYWRTELAELEAQWERIQAL
jgi:Ser/Thr protein kinase RdoA (MazF antagonist)